MLSRWACGNEDCDVVMLTPFVSRAANLANEEALTRNEGDTLDIETVVFSDGPTPTAQEMSL